MKTPLNIDQRAYVVGAQGICPECEVEVEWTDVDPNWYVCKPCVDRLMHGPAYDVAKQLLKDHS